MVSGLFADSEEGALEYYFLGEYELLNENYDKAEHYFLKAISLDSTSSSIYSSLSELSLLRGDYSKAINFVEKEYELNPSSYEIGLQLYELYIVNNKLDLADIHIKKMIDVMLDDIDLRLKLAELQFHNQNWKELIETYSEIYLLCSDDEKQKYFEFIYEIGVRTQQYESLILAFEKILNNTEDDIDILKEYSNLLYSIGEYEKATESLNKILINEPENTDFKLLLVEVYLRQNKIKLAETIIAQIDKDDKNSLSVLRMELIVYSIIENYEKLVEISKEMIKSHSDIPDGYENLGMVYMNLREDSLAIDILSSGFLKFPENANFPYLIADIYSLNKNYSTAQNFLHKALFISPENKQIRQSLATVYENLLDFGKSDSLYQQLISEDENDASILNNYAYNLCIRENVSIEELNYALEIVTKADEMENDNSAYLDTIGWIYYKLGNYSSAIEFIEKSIEIDSESLIILEHAGDIYIKLDKLEKATEYYQKALKLAPDNSILKDKIQRINYE